MKKSILIALLLPSAIHAAEVNPFDNHRWVSSLSGKSHVTTSKHAPFRMGNVTYDYSLSFELTLAGRGYTDACYQSSPTSLSCYTADHIKLNADGKSVSLHGGGLDYTLFTKESLENGSHLTGYWRRSGETNMKCGDGYTQQLFFPYNEASAKTFSGVIQDYKDPKNAMTLFLIKDEKGQFALSSSKTSKSNHTYHLYDQNNNAISDNDAINTVAKLNDSTGKYDESCTFTRD